MVAYCRTPLAADVDALAPRLRRADLDEIAARSGSKPADALRRGYLQSRPCYSIIRDTGQVEGMFGVVPTSDTAGAVWLLGSDALAVPPLSTRFLRQSRLWLDTLHTARPLLYNVIDERNALHVNWLRWLGFTFIKRHPRYGVEGRPFLEFVRLHHV